MRPPGSLTVRLVARATLVAALGCHAGPATGQIVNAARLAILQAEDRRAPNATDLTTIRVGTRSGDPQTALVAVRALGRLERPVLIADLLPALESAFAEVRAEAANALAQAASGVRRGRSGGPSPASLLKTLAQALGEEDEGDVRAAMAEAIGRLPYGDAEDVAAAERALGGLAAQHATVADRLGVAKGFEALARAVKGVALSPASLELLRGLVGVAPVAREEPLGGPLSTRSGQAADPSRDARVRRLAMEALLSAGGADQATSDRAFVDPDVQVRRLAVRAAARLLLPDLVTRALEDPSALVRYEAVRSLAEVGGGDACPRTLTATADPDPHVSLLAIDRLGACGQSDLVVTRLTDLASDASAIAQARGWHRPAHAMVALAAASPAGAKAVLPKHAQAREPFVRGYAARAAVILADRDTLERLLTDRDDNVVEAAVEGLEKVAGASATPHYVAALARRGYHVVRVAARALESSPAEPATIAALTSTLEGLMREDHDNSLDARRAIVATLLKLGAPVPKQAAEPLAPRSTLELAELRRLASPRARITVRDVGTVDIALITVEAPATVTQFVRLAESGYYNGLTIHRVVPTFVLQGGSPAANEYVGHPNYMRDELGRWPHVRGAIGVSTRGRDTGDAQFFLNLVDNPRLDHEYTVFGQIIAGMDVADRILEGDVIESIAILDAR